MRKDFLRTFITEFLVLVSGLAVFRLVAQVFGQDHFSEYALIRRTLSLLLPALLLGLSVGIPRYMSFSLKSERPETANAFFAAALAVLLPTTLAFGILFVIFKKFFAYLLFGDPAYASFILPMDLMLVGMILNAVAYSYYRGRLQMGKANLLQLLNMAVLPLPALLVAEDFRGLLTMTGVAWITCSTLFFATILKSLSWHRREIPPQAKKLLAYGLQRVPGDFGLAALLSLPAIFTTHLAGVRKGGAVAFGVSLLSMAGSAFAPIGLILLPKASQMLAERNAPLLRYYVRRIMAATVFMTGAGMLVFELFAERLITLYLGESYYDLIVATRIIVIGSLAYTVYVSLRSLIDAYYVKAINSLNIFISLFVFGLFALLAVVSLRSPVLIMIGFVLALWVLGFLTVRQTRKILKNDAVFS